MAPPLEACIDAGNGQRRPNSSETCRGLEPSTPVLSWVTEASLSDSTLSPEPAERTSGSCAGSPTRAGLNKFLLQQAREGRTVRFTSALGQGSPERADHQAPEGGIRAWQGLKDSTLAVSVPPASLRPASAYRPTASAPAYPLSSMGEQHPPPPGLPVSIPENGSARLPAMPRVKSTASMAGLPPIRKSYPPELQDLLQPRPGSAPPAWARQGRGSPGPASISPDASETDSASEGSGKPGVWETRDARQILKSPFWDMPPLSDSQLPTNPWAEAANMPWSAPPSPRPGTPETAKQRGSSAALEALRSCSSLTEGQGLGSWGDKRRGSSAALDALKSSDAGSDDSAGRRSSLSRHWSIVRERASKALTRQRSADRPLHLPPSGLRSLWRCSADPSCASPSSERRLSGEQRRLSSEQRRSSNEQRRSREQLREE